MNSPQFLPPHLSFPHQRRTPPLAHLAEPSCPLLPSSLLLLLYLSPGLLALVSRGHRNQSPGSPEVRRKDLEMRNDCPGLYPARCSDYYCYWPGSQQLNSCCPGIGRLRCRSHEIGLQLRLEVEQWKELSCQLSVLMLEGSESKPNPELSASLEETQVPPPHSLMNHALVICD